jgi:hypothetical protein
MGRNLLAAGCVTDGINSAAISVHSRQFGVTCGLFAATTAFFMRR